MKLRGAAPLTLGLVLHAGLLLTLLFIAHRTQTPLSITDPDRRFAEYGTLYEASSNRDYAYNVADNHFTPVAILGNASLTLLPQTAALWVFSGLCFLALLGAGWLAFNALEIGSGDNRERRLLFVLAALLTAFSAPLFHLFYAGNIDCFVLLLIAAALFLMRASQRPEESDASPRSRKNLDLLAGAALAFAAGLNPLCAVLIVPVLCLRRFRVAAGMLGGVLLIYALAPAMWASYVAHHVESPEFIYTGDQNASAFIGAHLFVRPRPLGLIPFPALPRFEAMVALMALMFTAFIVDVKLRWAGELRSDVLVFATYIPLVLIVPITIHPHALTLHLLMIPALLALWKAGEHRVQRIGVAIAMAGLVLTQSYIPDAEPAVGSLIPFAFPALGTMLVVFGLLVCKIGLLARHGLLRKPSMPVVSLPVPNSRYVLWILACASAAYFMFAYWRYGHCPSVVAGWLITMILLYVSFKPAEDRPLRRWKRRDALIAAGLVLLFSAPYLMSLHAYPVQVNTDEFSAIHTMNRLLNDHQDWYGVNSGYNFFPTGSFMLIGAISRVLGGVTIEHVRQTNALFGLGCIVAAYVLFRQFYRWKYAVIGAVLVGCSHVLLGLSRMAIRDNLPLFIELMALAFFVAAWRRRHFGLMFLGGVVAGLGVYNYFSARIVLFVWLMFLGVNLLRKFSAESLKRSVQCAVVTGLGYGVCSAPMLIATYVAPAECLEYPKAQVVLFPQGLNEVCAWEGTQDKAQAILRNAGKGLTMFNNNVADHANIYCNPGFGFVDPLTGVLLWLGVARAICKRRKTMRDVLGLAGFSIWIPLSLLLTKCPAYSRMLIMLPFVLMLALDGARVAVRLLSRLLWASSSRRLLTRFLATVVVAICLVNAWAYRQHVKRGIDEGDAPGNTMRYAESRSTDPQYRFYMVMDDAYPYFWFGRDAWKPWIEYFLPPGQSLTLIPSDSFLKPWRDLHELSRPCSIFMSGALYKKCERKLRREFPDLTLQKITTSGDQLVIDLP